MDTNHGEENSLTTSWNFYKLIWFWMLVWKKGCRFISSDQILWEMCRAEFRPYHDFKSYLNSAPVLRLKPDTKFCVSGNGSATFQEHFSICLFLIALPISQLWPLPFSFKLPFITVFSASWQLFCFSALKNLPPYWPLYLNSVPASTFTHKYLNAVVYTCWISSSVIKIIQVYCGEKKIECFVMSNNSLKWFSLQ